MAKSDPEAKGSPCYQIAHGWKNEFGSFNLETLKFPMHFREPRSSLYFIFIIHTHIYFVLLFFLYIYIFSFFILIFLFLFLSFFHFLICSP
jgi:hypothetical protein